MSGGKLSGPATRRELLLQAGLAAGFFVSGCRLGRPTAPDPPPMEPVKEELPQDRKGIVLFLCGDVMTGRGIDQILPHPGDPRLHEPYLKDAREYVALAERASGPIPRAVEPSYPWGGALAELGRARPDVRIGNLETAVTARGEPAPGKGIHYRMHPANAPCLEALGLDACTRRFRLERPTRADVRWMQKTLHRESGKLGAAAEVDEDGRLALRWR